MKSNLFRKIVAGTSALAMVGTLGFTPIIADAAEYAEQTVDLSAFDRNGSYDEGSGTETLTFGNSKVWSKLDLSQYTQKGTEKTMQVKIEYTDTVSSAGRINIGFYDADQAVYATNGWEDTVGSYLVYGVLGSNIDKRVYVNGTGAKGNGKFQVDAEQKVSVIIDFENGTISGTVGDHALATTEFDSSTLDSVDVMGIYSWSATEYKISDMKITTVTSTDTYYDVTYNVNGTETKESVKSGEYVANVPDTTVGGKVFDGWKMSGDDEKLYTTEEIKALAITGNTTFTAQYHDDEAYVQKIQSVEFVKSKADAILQPAEGATDTYDYEIKVTSDIGVDISSLCNVTWTIVGNEADDDYIALTQDAADKHKAVLSVKNGVSTYYGYIKADVTYDPANSDNEADNTSASVQVPYAILGSTTTSNIIPAGGYPVDMSVYPDSLVGYQATSDGLNTKDLVLNNWSIYGSNPTRNLELVSYEDGSKALKFDTTGGNHGGTGSSTVGVYQWPAPSSQYTIEAVAKFANGGALGVYSNTPNNTGAQAQCAVSISGGSLSAGGETVSGFSTDTFYKIIMSADPVSGAYYVKAYDPQTNELKGEINDLTGSTDTMKFLCVSGGFPVEIKSIRVYAPQIASIAINSADTVTVPKDDSPAAEELLAAACLDTDGYKILGDVTWSLEEEYANVELVPNGQQATLKVSPGAAGMITVKAVKDGKEAKKTIMLSTSDEAVSITGPSSITIPFDGEADVTAVYKAQTFKEGAELTDVTSEFSFLDKDGATPLEKLPNGVTFDADTATLTVTSDAKAAIIYIKAKNSNGIEAKSRINIHGMSFSFGTAEPEEGYTQITSANLYSDSVGYGFVSSEGLTDGENAVTGSASYIVKVKVPNGNYRVNIDTTSASMLSEAVSGSATGISKSGSQFDVAVCDGVMDLTFNAESSISTLSLTQLKKEALAVPALYSIGDSTTKNSGHPSGYDPATSTDHRTYGSWGNCVTAEMYDGVFSSYSNHGMAGRNSSSFYNEGRLEAVLLSIAPGDYVTVNMGINTDKSGAEPYEQLMEYYYVQGIIQRGGIPVILTHTPQNPVGNYVGNYDAATGTFNCSRAGDGRVEFLRSLATKYELDLIDIGKWGNDFFNSLEATPETLALANTQNKDVEGYKAPETVYELVASWSPDHNHYTAELGTIYAEYILGELDTIVNGGSIDPTPTTDPNPTTQPTTDPVEPTTQPTTDPVEPTTQPTTDPVEPTTQPTTDPVEPTVDPSTGVQMSYTDGNVVITSDSEQNAVLVYASYTDGRLTGVKAETVAIMANEPFTKAMAANNGDKFMLWNTIADMVPVTDAVVVEGVPVVETEAPSEPTTEPTADPGEPDEPQATVNPDAEAKIIWKASADDNGKAADTELANGLSIMFDATYADFTMSDEDPTPEKRVIEGVEFTGYISHPTMNGSWSGTTVDPAKSTVLKYTAPADGVASFYLSNVGTNKKICVGQDGMSKGEIEEAGIVGTGDDMVVPINVKSGSTYYVYVAGSKGRFIGVAFEEGASVEEPVVTPTDPPSVPEPEENTWAVSAAYNGCPAGTELMVGLTTLFTNTGSNGKYITSGDDFSIVDGVATGTGLKYEAQNSGTLSVSFIDLGATKAVCIVEDGKTESEAIDMFTNDTTEKINGEVSGQVEAGKTYYIYGKGTKARFTAASFTAE